MKAKIVKPPVLSISMIVKNEGKKLRRCLDSVKKIMDKIDCQLIITDTGSTDDTVAIAKEYAHIVNYFDWCDDYSAARNFGLELATGEWYAFIDADEWYSDELVDSIVNFFKGNTYNDFNSCAMLMRNYKDDEHYDFTDFNVVRLHKLSKATRFVNKIHENIIYVSPTYPLNGICFHDGYSFSSEKTAFEEKYNKYNSAIEKQLSTDGDNLNLLVSYLASVQDIDREEEVVLKSLALAKEKNILSTCNTVYFHVVFHFVNCKKYKTALAYAKEYISEMAKHNYEIYLDGNYAIALAAVFAKEYDMAVEYADKYLKGYDEYLLSPYAFNALTIVSVSKTTKESFLLDMVNNFCDDDAKTALKYYKQYSFDNGKYYTQLFDLLISKYIKSPCKEVLFALIDTYKKVENCERREVLQDKLAALLFKQINNEIVYAHLKAYNQDNIFVCAFCYMHGAKANASLAYTSPTVDKLCQNGALAPYLAATMYLHQDVKLILSALNREQISHAAKMLANLGDALPSLCLENISNAQNASEITELIFYISILDDAFNLVDKTDDKSRNILARCLMSCIAMYSQLFYSPLLLNTSQDMLPAAHRFALQIYNADKSVPAQYISTLREALKKSPSMKEMAQILLDNYETEIENVGAETKSEFEILAEGVKQNAKQLIADKLFADATAVLAQLKALVPNDTEIDNLLLMCK